MNVLYKQILVNSTVRLVIPDKNATKAELDSYYIGAVEVWFEEALKLRNKYITEGLNSTVAELEKIIIENWRYMRESSNRLSEIELEIAEFNEQ